MRPTHASGLGMEKELDTHQIVRRKQPLAQVGWVKVAIKIEAKLRWLF